MTRNGRGWHGARSSSRMIDRTRSGEQSKPAAADLRGYGGIRTCRAKDRRTPECAAQEYLCESKLLIAAGFPVVETGGGDLEPAAAVGDRYYRRTVRDIGIDELVLRHYLGSRAKYEAAFFRKAASARSSRFSRSSWTRRARLVRVSSVSGPPPWGSRYFTIYGQPLSMDFENRGSGVCHARESRCIDASAEPELFCANDVEVEGARR